MKKPGNVDELNVLKEAYRIANQKDNDQVKFLKESHDPSAWDDIYSLYNRLKYRQQQLERLNPNLLNQINFKKIDYDSEIIEAKKKAADFYYKNGTNELLKGDRFSAREAYYNFQKVKNLYPTYQNIDNLLNEALEKGITHVNFKILNQTNIMLPRNFETEIKKISLKDVNSMWINYDTRIVENNYYDYTILLRLKSIVVSPGLVKEREYVETKEIEDGWQYVLDKKGNVMKDTLGNDIKVTKYATIKGFVLEVTMTKSAKLTGTLDFYDNHSKQLIKTEPIMAETIFEHRFGEARGDLDALGNESKKLCSIKPLPFPTDEDLIFDTNEHLKNLAKNIIHTHKHVLK